MDNIIGKVTLLLCVFFISLSWTLNLSASQTKEFKITAQKYTFNPKTIEVEQGDRVTLELTAVDTKHGIGIKAYNVDRVLPKGETIRIEFIADKKGEFEIKCTKFCGWRHFSMSSTFIVR